MKNKRFMMVMGVIAWMSVAWGQGLPVAEPGPLGMSPGRLQRLTDAMEQYVETEQLPGVVAMICREGKVVYHEALGTMDKAQGKAMQPDAMFRIASMSKPITSVAVMMLYEEGRFLLTEPVSKYIPEFEDPQVVTRDPNSGEVVRVPAKREVTIRHLLNHTAGLTYAAGLHRPIYQEAGIPMGLEPVDSTIAEEMKKLAGLPLIAHPGEEFHYGLSLDMLGYLVEVVSGQPFDEFLQERIFDPLGMVDTGFVVPQDKLARVAKTYRYVDGQMRESNVDLSLLTTQTYYSGGAGLVSTTADYARFAQMILNKGQLGGIRLLSPKTVELMTTNSIGDLYIPFRIIGDKFGYGFGIRTERGEYDELESLGIFGWDGAFYTRCWMDPEEDLIGIFLSQIDGYWGNNTMAKLRVLTYQAIVE